MLRLPPRSTRTDTRFPYTTLFRAAAVGGRQRLGGVAQDGQRCVRQLAATEVSFSLPGSPLDWRAWPVARIQQAQDSVEVGEVLRSEEHTSELQSLMRISYAVFCLKKKHVISTLHE